MVWLATLCLGRRWINLPGIGSLTTPFLLAGLLGLKTLVVKMCSVTLSMAGGLIAGKEGPFIHAGGIVGGGWAGMGSRSAQRGSTFQSHTAVTAHVTIHDSRIQFALEHMPEALALRLLVAPTVQWHISSLQFGITGHNAPFKI